MKVNMTPNPLDVVTIHASQNDGEARQWEFELHNNGELIDTSDVKEQMVFKAYKGGTEQLLPENGSTPTTSPFKGDIRYPQGLLTDQEFTYRQSPTEEDGLAKITDIKGNTIVWNQLVQNGNFESTSGWSSVRGTISTLNKILSYSVTELGGGGLQNRILQNISIPANHKVFYSLNINPPKAFSVIMNIGGEFTAKETAVPNTWNLCRGIMTLSSAMTDFRFGCPSNVGNMAVGDVIQFKDVMLIDLTKMGLDSITDPSEFTSLFPLFYYSYNQGSLLSFNGNGIKTVGFNQWDGETESGYIYNGVLYDSNDYWRTKNYIPVIANETYYFNVSSTQGQISFYDANKVYVSSANSMGGSTHLVTIPDGCAFAKFYQPISSDSSNVCVNISGDTDGTYKTYTESVLSLPISTYFPTGMKSAGNVYDELTESKAIKRVQELIFNGDCIQSAGKEANMWRVILKPSYYYSVSAGYQAGWCNQFTVKQNYNDVNTSNMSIAFNKPEGDQILVRNDAYTSVYDIINAWNTNNVVVYLPLATPTETSFTTASLVTENAEIPLSNNDGVLIGKCTEQLSSESGFIDAKIKLADADGECYSNKLQLHIERSPQ